jgi:homoserine acetyltransferase
VLAPPLDLFNPAESARAAAGAIPNATFVEIPSEQGHQAATQLRSEDVDFLNATIGAFLHGT